VSSVFDGSPCCVGPDRRLPNAAISDVQIKAAKNQTVVFTHGRVAFPIVTDAVAPEDGRRQRR
jgi:hypothetical protein